jgi:DNA invertase Pin-like site-specific DNA recombinase
LKKAGCQKVFREKVNRLQSATGRNFSVLDQIRTGYIIVVWKFDRLARSTRDLLNTMDTINEAGSKYHNTRRQDDHDGFLLGIADYVEYAIMQSDRAEMELWPACR